MPHSKAAFASMGADPALGNARYLWGHIERRGVLALTKRDAFNWTRGRFKQASELDAPLKILVDHNYLLEQASEERLGPGRRRSLVYQVNRLALTQYSHNAQNQR